MFLAWSFAFLLEYPAPYSDEPWLMNGPVTLLRTGHNALPMFGQHYNASLYYNGYLAAFLGVLGTTLAAARAVTVLHGVGCLVVAYFLSRRLGGARFAWVSPLLLLVLFPFSELAHYVRPDVLETFWSLLAVLLFAARRPMAGGVCAGFAFGLFAQSVWVFLVVGVWALPDLARRRPMPLVRFAAAAAAALVPLAIFIARDAHAYSSFQSRFGVSTPYSQDRLAHGFLSGLWEIARHEPDRYRGLAHDVTSASYVGGLIVLAVVTIGFALLRRRWRELVLLASPLATFAILAGNKTPAYLAVAAPALAITAATSIPWRHPLAAIIAFAFLAVPYGNRIDARVAPIRTGFDTVAAAYRYPFPRHAVVIGLPLDYAYLVSDHDIDFRASHFFTRQSDFAVDTPAAKERKLARLARLHPVYLIYNASVFEQTLRQFKLGPDRVAGLKRLVERHFRVVRRIHLKHTVYGTLDDTILVYRP